MSPVLIFFILCMAELSVLSLPQRKQQPTLGFQGTLQAQAQLARAISAGLASQHPIGSSQRIAKCVFRVRYRRWMNKQGS